MRNYVLFNLKDAYQLAKACADFCNYNGCERRGIGDRWTIVVVDGDSGGCQQWWRR